MEAGGRGLPCYQARLQNATSTTYLGQVTGLDMNEFEGEDLQQLAEHDPAAIE